MKELPEGPDLHSAIVSGDGMSIYALVEARVVDVGWLLNAQRWFMVNIAGGMAVVVLVVWIWRAAKRRGLPDRRYCRKCHYDLTAPAGAGGARGAAVERCPECGSELARRPPVAGRRMWRRIAAPATLLLLVVAACVWYGTDGRKRFSEPFPGGRWGSMRLLGLGELLRITTITNAAGKGDLLLELDLQSGATRRVIATRARRTYWPMAINRSANAVYVTSGNAGVDLVSVEDGRVLASLADARASSLTAHYIAGHSADERLVYICAQDAVSTRTDLVEWEWQRGKRRTLASAGAYTAGSNLSPRHFMRVPGEPPRFLRYPGFSEVFHSKTYVVAVLDASGNQVAFNSYGEEVSTHGPPVFNGDGSMMFLTQHHGYSVKGFETASLAAVGDLMLNEPSPPYGLAMRHDGKLLLLPRQRSVWVRDILEKKWLAHLHHPADCYAPRSVSFSDDGLVVAAVFQSGGISGAGAKGVSFKLAVWRLPEEYRSVESALSGGSSK